MKRNAWVWLSVILVMAVSTGVIRAQSEEADSPIDPQAEALVRQLSEHMAGIKHFSFRVQDAIDEVQETGQKLQFSHIRSGTVSRPDKVKVESSGDITNRALWKDGKTVTLLDKDHNVYGQVEFSGTIDEMMDRLLERYGVSIPLADLLSSNPYDVLMAEVETGQYVGLGIVGEIECHHLAFTQEEIDWQIWIDAGEKLALRKLVISYKLLPGAPQYCATLLSVSQSSEAPPLETFQCTLPVDAEKVEFLPVQKIDEENAAAASQ